MERWKDVRRKKEQAEIERMFVFGCVCVSASEALC